MATLANFSKALNKIKLRQGNVFFSDDDGTTWNAGGVVANLRWGATPVVTRRDSGGRIIQFGYDVSVGFEFLQSAYEGELEGFEALLDDTGNGIWVKLTDQPSTGAAAGVADGVVFKNVTPQITPEVNYSGEESVSSVEMTGRVGKDAFADFTATGGTVTFDA